MRREEKLAGPQHSSLGPGSIIAGRYEVRTHLGSGGMGEVYQVVDHELNDQIVALKLLHANLAQDEQIFQRFRNEVFLARSLIHPNIVRIYDLGKAPEGYYFMTMEYVHGVTLKERIESGRSPGSSSDTTKTSYPLLTFPNAISILDQMLQGMEYAHSQGIIHRDLKPANVMLSHTGEVKLLDFGMARFLENHLGLTMTGQVIGTPMYMSPEQVQGEALDTRSDIYSLAIIGHELVTGERPFSAENAMAAMFKHLNEPIPPMPPSIPAWFQAVIAKGAAKKPAERFATVAEFRAALAARETLPITNSPPVNPPRRARIIPFVGVMLAAAGLSVWMLPKYQSDPPARAPKVVPSPERTPVLQVATVIPTPSPRPLTPVATPTPVETQTSIPSPAAETLQPPVSVPSASSALPAIETPNLPPSQLPKAAAARAEIFLRDPASTQSDTSFPLERAREIRWVADIRGVASTSTESVSQDFRLSLQDSSGSTVSEAFSLSILSYGPEGSSSLKLHGTFSKLLPQFLEPGIYQLTVYHRGERVGEQRFELTR